ncbi:hypothetical protein, partial [uncultured Phascolarctobacterium sp.]|uniref:hypothetical protein n=1 Tax=uncultured Phascolarctobacterium sp. TaxID=512296 RepID=UPI0027D96AAE
MTNDNATIYTAGTNKITAVTVENSNSAYLHSGGSTEIDAKALHNDNASIDAGADLHLTIPAITNENDAYLGVGGTLTVEGGSLVNQNKAYVGAGKDVIYSGQVVNNNNGSYIGAGRDAVFTAAVLFANSQKATLAVGGDLHLQTQVLTNADASAIAVGGSAELLAQANLSNSGGSQLEIQRRAAITTGVLLNENSYLGIGGDAEISAADELRNTDGSYLAVDGSAVITAGRFANSGNSSVFVTKNLELTGAGDFLNEDGLIAIGGSGVISAANIYNQNGAGLAYGSLLNAAGSLTLNAQGTLLNRSSDIESQQQITISARDLINKKDVFETSFAETHQEVSYKIPHLQGSRYYDAVRRFDRQILTGVIDEETNDANIISGGDMTIVLQNNLTNHYSKIAAGGNLTVDAGGTAENIGYQGTKHYYDNGEDTHYWKYKKHRRFHVGCKWIYGTTVIPYSDHTVYDLPPGATSERRSLLSGATGIKINAGKIVNRTIQADGREYVATDDTNHEILQNNVTVPEYKEKEGVGTNVGAELDNSSASAAVPVQLKKLLDIGQLAINSKIYTLNADPSAKYLVETNKKYADYHEFLSSDYLLERVKADPEKVSKRLGDGYFEQKLVIEQITQLTGRQYLENYGSDMEQYAALMEAGALAAQEMQLTIGVGLTAQQVATLKSDIVWLVEEPVNGQKVLVPEVYLAGVREEDLKPSGALIIGGEVELYSKQDIENIGTIKADGTVALRGENLLNRGAVAGENIQAEAG